MAAVLEMPAQAQQPELENKALSLVDQAKAITITDAETYQIAGLLLKDVAAMRREIQEHHAPMKQKAHEAHRAICDAENKMLAPVTAAETVLKCGIGTWDLYQRRLTEQKQREAREKAEREAMERQEAELAEAEKQGASAGEIGAIIEAPLIVHAPAVQHEAPKVQGVSTAKSYRAVVTNIRKLAQAVADGTVPHTLILANEPALNAMARAQKGIMQIPGVQVEEVAQVRAGRR